MQPSVSVVMAAYNVENYIKKAVQSVLEQTFQDFEIIIIDDCSSDGTTDAVKEMDDARIRLYVNESNRGPSYSRNRAIQSAKGIWIAVLDADDWWDESRLDCLLSLANNHNADIVADDLYLIRDGEQQPWTTYFKSRERVIGSVQDCTAIDAAKMIRDDYGYLNPLISAKLIHGNKLEYKDGLHYGEDFRFVLECLLAGGHMRVSTRPMYYYRIRENSLTAEAKAITSFRAQLESINQLLEKYTGNKNIVYELHKYKRKKYVTLTEITVQAGLKEGEIIKPLLAVIRYPFVIKPLLRKLIQF